MVRMSEAIRVGPGISTERLGGSEGTSRNIWCSRLSGVLRFLMDERVKAAGV